MSSEAVVWAAGWFSLLCGIAAVVASLASVVRFPVRLRPVIVVLVLIAVVVVPVGSTTPIAILFGAVGPLSMAGVMASCAVAAQRFGVRRRYRQLDLLTCAAAIALLGVVLYPAAVGLARIDPYRWGFHGFILPLILFVLASLGLYLRSTLLPLWISLAILAWLAGLYGSDNLWDYLIDPIVWAAAIAFLLGAGAHALWRHFRFRPDPISVA